MSRAKEQLLAGEVGRVDELIAAREDDVFDEAPQLEVQDRAVGVPHDQPRPDVFLNREQILLLADDAMVALARFFEPGGVLLQRFFGKPRRAVDALQHLALLIAAPVRARRMQQFEKLALSCARHVWAAAQIYERT